MRSPGCARAIRSTAASTRATMLLARLRRRGRLARPESARRSRRGSAPTTSRRRSRAGPGRRPPARRAARRRSPPSRARGEVARVDGVERHRSQLVGEPARLRPSRGVERRVGPALPAALAVPVGLAVACEEEGRHRAANVATRGSRSQQARSASSPARRAASVSRSRGASPTKAPTSSRPDGAPAGPASCTSPPT